MSRVVFLALLIVVLAACASSQPAVSSVAVSGAANNVLKLGSEVQFSAAAKDASGNTLEGKTFTWVSSNPSIASVDNSGKVKANRIGKVTLTATVDGVSGQSAEQSTFGLEFVAGVSLEPSGDTVGTTFAFRLRQASGAEVPAGKFLITGPTGFNGGNVYEVSSAAGFFTSFVSTDGVAALQALAGTYSVTTTVGTETFTASSSLTAADIAAPLARPTGLSLGAVSTTSVTASWSPVAGAASYRVIVFDSASREVLARVFTASPTVTLSSLSLNPASTTLFVVVTASNMDWRLDVRNGIPLPSVHKLSGAAVRVVFP